MSSTCQAAVERNSQNIPDGNKQTTTQTGNDDMVKRLQQQKEALNDKIKELKYANEELQRILLQQQCKSKENKCMECDQEGFEEEHEQHPTASNELMMAFQSMHTMGMTPTNTGTNILCENEMKQLCEWVNKHELNVVYDSRNQPFTRDNCMKAFTEAADMIHGIVILIHTENDEVFGSYHHVVPCELGAWCQDPQHFIFTLRNRNNVMQKYTTDKGDYALMVPDFIDDDDEMNSAILEMGYFYTITMNQVASINPSYTSHYHVPSPALDIVVKDLASIPVKEILFLC